MSDSPVTHSRDPIVLARLPSGRPVETAVHRYEGEDPGPTVYLQALQHGGEVNGAAVLRRLHADLVTADLSGTVIAVPVANPLAFDHRVYMSPTRLDAINSNMNRLWPGDVSGTLVERMVARLWSLVEDADAVVDLHTGGPYMLSHTRFTPGDPRSRDLATAFGIDLVVEDGEDPEELEEPPTGKLREVAAASGIPSITPELAHSREIVKDSVDRGCEGVRNVLSELGVLDAPVEVGDPTVARDKTALFTGESGLFRSDDVAVGDSIEPGTAIGSIFDPTSYETLETIEAEQGGVLLSLNRGSTVVEGESVGSVVQVE